MAKINVVITDKDELYLNRLANYLIAKSDVLNVTSFTSQQLLNQYLENQANKIDALIIPVEFINDYIKQASIPAKIILAEGAPGNKVEDFEYINKYQKVDKFISDILLIFSEKTGRTDAVTKGNKNTKIIGVYSPVGGSGKTTIALALSTLSANSGLRVFYLNFEKINSSEAFFEKAPNGNVSDVFLALKTKGANVGLKLISNRYTDPVTKISYFNSPDSGMEYNELTKEETMQLLHEFDALGEYDIVFVDMQSAFDEYNLGILSCCDKILIPFGQDRVSLTKMTSFLNEFQFHDSLSSLASKIHLIANKVDANGALNIQSSGITQFKPVEAFISFSSVFADVKNLSNAGNLSQTPLMSFAHSLMQQ